MSKNTDSKFKTKTGWLCLDFANTVDWHASPHPEENLSTYRDLVTWAKEVAIVSSDEAEALSANGENRPEAGREILTQSIELREAIYRILSGHAWGTEIKDDDLSILNAAIARMNLKLAEDNGSFALDWAVDIQQPDSIMWPVIWSMVELLTSDALDRMGQCADERGCGWFFWDSSRNRTRRWCDMQDCGNRAKSRRHYRRSHSNPESGLSVSPDSK